jgi:hypothetical protein
VVRLVVSLWFVGSLLRVMVNHQVRVVYCPRANTLLVLVSWLACRVEYEYEYGSIRGERVVRSERVVGLKVSLGLSLLRKVVCWVSCVVCACVERVITSAFRYD